MNKLIRRGIALAAFPAVLALSACDDDDDPMTMVEEPMTIVQTAQDAGAFSTLLTALNAAGLTSALEAQGPFTVFAPTDDAFAAIDNEVLGDLIDDTELLTAVLTYHVVPGAFTAADVSGLSSAPTLNGKDLSLSTDGGMVMVDGATVISADIEASNGIIHVIDEVLLPEAIADIIQVARGAEIFSTLLTAVEAAGLTDVLKGDGPFTVFAPTDDAFAAVDPDALNALLADPTALASVLTYHVVPGTFAAADVLASSSLSTVNGAEAAISLDGDGNPRIDEAIIVATDIEARNGIVHVIDRVIFPETPADIIDVAQGAEIFNTLLTALNAAGLTDALRGEGPLTVFAPTDDAFAAIDSEVLNDLISDPQLLTAVLTYHVVPGRFAAADVISLDSAPTLNGKDLALSFDGTSVMVDQATVVSADIEASNGIIHVINEVLLPEAIADIIQVARGAEIFNTLLTAVEAAGLTDVLKGDGPFTVFAPTDDAFAAVDPDALNALLADPTALAAVLTYHVVPGNLAAADVLASSSLATVNGAEAAISLDGEGNPRIDGAKIVATDIAARNGIVHVIDQVIFPD